MNNMSEEKMLQFVESLKLDEFNDINMMKYKNQALQTQEIFYEISLNISNFFHKGFKRGGGIITPINDNIRGFKKGITDFAHGINNELYKITNGTGLLIMSIYQNMIVGKIENYTLKDPKHLKDIKNIITALLIDLLNKYKKHKNPQKLYLFGGKKNKKKKKGGVAESILITSIIIAAIWALIQMFDNIHAKYEKWTKENQRNSPVFPKPTREMEKIKDQLNKQETPKTPKKQVTPKKEERKGLFKRLFRGFPKV